MLDNQNETRALIATVKELLKAEQSRAFDIVSKAISSSIELSHYDNWNGGTYYYALSFVLEVSEFVKIRDEVQSIETEILEKAELAARHYQQSNEFISKILLIPKAVSRIDWDSLQGVTSQSGLLKEINFLKDTMISVSTGGPKIHDVEADYVKAYARVDSLLKRLNVSNPNPYKSLWEWYGKWSSGDLPQYKDRRSFVRDMHTSTIELLSETDMAPVQSVNIDLSNWERLERSIKEINSRQKEASAEEQFQVVGLLCRETIITLAQAVYIEAKHPSIDGVSIGKTDAKRMLESYIMVELAGGENEILRKYARVTNDLANVLTHKRTATRKDAALCASATIALVNFIGTLEGRF
ncbi:hypothetical protein [Haliscomenobacter hydrossis]|uniref:Abortive infection protein-like C-terminal domain-containing protein n=1 Tax=Haliscomenobacter hydrossis (strain ATCC 27775 / DSM 1100 / LMG 10767 / O) TaxID=760192 RepID=F4L7L4_HALH1|nr:hypothetical protein [Haliscomenobacter hydrossis]AEE54372.1 hypothetical protein Halhy_6556 [Haliscomenobacter hydrossis DSM 1100]